MTTANLKIFGRTTKIYFLKIFTQFRFQPEKGLCIRVNLIELSDKGIFVVLINLIIYKF